VAEGIGLMEGVARDVDEAIAAMESLRSRISEEIPLDENAAKQLAAKLAGRLPVIYGAEVLTEVAHRWKTQLNESPKVWAFHEELPEASHNALVSYGLPEEVARLAFVVYLRSPDFHPRLALHYDSSQRALGEAGIEYAEVEAEGRSAVAQAMTCVLMGDYVSYYLALLNGLDPTPTTVIDDFKVWLAQQP
jgi:glucose/mannose-6-phosphate isomerase